MTRPISRRRLLAVSAATPLALAVGSVPVVAQDPIPPPDTSPDRMATVGIAAGQLARLSAFHHVDQAVGPCGFRVDFLGIDGKMVATGNGMVMPGQGAFLDFDLAANLKRGERLQVHCNVTVPQGHENHIGATLELFDAKTGETAIPGAPCLTPTPVERMEMGTVGVVRGQIARLSLFHHAEIPGSPCLFKIEIFGLDGKLLATDSGTLMPGQGAFFDYDLAGTTRRNDERVQFHATVRLPPGHDVGSLIEIFDSKTGLPAFIANPEIANPEIANPENRRDAAQ